MALIVSPTETEINTALRAFLLAVLPTGVEVIRGQINRVPEPKLSDFVVMLPTMRQRISTNVDTFIDTTAPIPAIGSNTFTQSTQVTIQLDVHGPSSADNAQTISTMLRDTFAGDFFASYPNISPLFSDDPKQVPFGNGEQQVEWRWTLDAQLQVNATVSGATQEFATTVTADLINVDKTFPQ